MISAIKSDNPIELLNYISNTFPKVHSRVRFNNIFALLTYSLIQSATQAVTQSISLSHCRTVPPSHCPSGSQSVCHVVILSLNQRRMPALARCQNRNGAHLFI